MFSVFANVCYAVFDVTCVIYAMIIVYSLLRKKQAVLAVLVIGCAMDLLLLFCFIASILNKDYIMCSIYGVLCGLLLSGYMRKLIHYLERRRGDDDDFHDDGEDDDPGGGPDGGLSKKVSDEVAEILNKNLFV